MHLHIMGATPRPQLDAMFPDTLDLDLQSIVCLSFSSVWMTKCSVYLKGALKVEEMA